MGPTLIMRSNAVQNSGVTDRHQSVPLESLCAVPHADRSICGIADGPPDAQQGEGNKVPPGWRRSKSNGCPTDMPLPNLPPSNDQERDEVEAGDRKVRVDNLTVARQ